MKPRDGTASDGDTDKGKHWTGKNKAAAIDEFCNGGHLEGRINQHHGDCEQGDCAELQERAEVIARGK